MFQYSITPNRITRFKQQEFKPMETRVRIPRETPSISNISLENLKKKRPINELSPNARKRLQRAVNWLVYLSEPRKEKVTQRKSVNNFRVAFITLHLPSQQKHPHGEIIQRSLNNFLTVIRKNHQVSNYVWRAELQQNGNLHFHILVDKVIHHKLIRQYWNQSIELLGYVSAYQEKFSKLTLQEYLQLRKVNDYKSIKKAKKAYHKGIETNWSQPNSTDVHSLRNVKNAAAYVSKYVTKSKPESPTTEYEESLKLLKGRLWFCSQSISRLKSVIINETVETLHKFRKLTELENVYCFEGDYFTFLSFDFSNVFNDFVDDLRSLLFLHSWRSGYILPFVPHP